MSNEETEGWFDDSEKKVGPPSGGARFKEVGDSVVGEVVDKFLIDYKNIITKEVELDDDGKAIKQLVIVLQTDHRNWEQVNKHPQDKDGVNLPNEADTGLRAVYARKWTNIYAALGLSIRESGVENPSKHPAVGGKFGVQFFEEEDTGKPSKLKKFRAKYTPPAPKAADDGWFDGGEAKNSTQHQARAEDQAESKPAAKAKATSVAEEEPPF